MLTRLSKLMVATGAAATITTGAMLPRPASADTTSTILTAAAAIGAVMLYSNYQHKQAAANTVVGYTQNGGTVYADGRVVMPNGQTYYPNSNNNGQYGYTYPVNNPNYGQYNNGQYNNAQYGNNGNGSGRYNNGQYASNGARWNADQDAARKRDRDRR